jgi:hypothetical protein
MKIRLLEKLWRHTIPSGESKILNDAIDSGRIEKIKEAAVSLLELSKNFFDVEEDDYVINEIDELIEEFMNLDLTSTIDDADFLLGQFYDFMDGYSIFIGSEEEQVSLDVSK